MNLCLNSKYLTWVLLASWIKDSVTWSEFTNPQDGTTISRVILDLKYTNGNYLNPYRADLWIFRMMGKPQFFLPEQFTQEWDFQASINLDYLRNEETAGNYHWWSNLYQVGWIMWSLITHCYPPAPPPLWPYQYPAIGDDDEDVTVKGYTYGGHLVNEAYTDYDRSLREIIMRMLDHNPRHRPSMMYMEEVLAEKTRRDDPLRRNMETDEQLKESTYRVFGEP